MSLSEKIEVLASELDSAYAEIARLKREAQQHQGEPVAWMAWNENSIYVTAIHPKEQELDSFVMRGHRIVARIPLYTSADPAEVERLRKELDESNKSLDLLAEGKLGALEIMADLFIEQDGLLRECLENKEGLAYETDLLNRINSLLNKNIADRQKTTEFRNCQATQNRPQGFQITPNIIDAHDRSQHFEFSKEAALSTSAEPSAPVAIRCSFCDAVDSEGNPWSGSHSTVDGKLIYRVMGCKEHRDLVDAVTKHMQSSAPAESDERTEFEKHYASKNDGFVPPFFDGEYDWHDAQPCWESWQARAALERK